MSDGVFQSMDIRRYSEISSHFAIGDEGAMLIATFVGKYGKGSAGNGDGIFMFAQLAAHYFVFEPFVIILDLRKLEYLWGNTLSKSLHFYHEIGRDNCERGRLMLVVAEGDSLKAMKGLCEVIPGGKTVFCNTIEDCFREARSEIVRFLE